jgi:hypothetical protein
MVNPAWARLKTVWLPTPHEGFYPGSITESWIVYAAWPLVAIVLAVLVVRRRDV